MKLARTALAVLAASLALGVPSSAFAPQKPAGKAKEAAAPAPNPEDHVEALDDLGLKLTIPAAITELKPFSEKEKSSMLRVGWHAKAGASSLDILLWVMPSKEYHYHEPEDVNDTMLSNLRERTDASFAFEKTELASGPFGFTTLGAIGSGPIHGADGKTVVSSYAMLGGLLEQQGYCLEVFARPALDAAGEKLVLDFLRKGLVYSGPKLDPKWTDSECTERWKRDVPPKLVNDLQKIVRTEHYVFLSNTTAAKLMGEAMEKNYAAIQKMYPFKEVPGRRLMPVFLFRSPEEYQEFYAKVFSSEVTEGAKSKGVAYSDFYATYYDAPQDPVHIHEMTHQIFRNRLRLAGGGSWFQEGVAEYICTRASDRTDAANAVKKESTRSSPTSCRSRASCGAPRRTRRARTPRRPATRKPRS